MAVISVMNYKGGVGKTTLTANIAAEMAKTGMEVLLVDLDPQANLTLSFISIEQWQNLDRLERTVKHWYDAYLDKDEDMSLKDLIISPPMVNSRLDTDPESGRIDLICSHLELINVDMELSSRLGGNTDRTIRSNYLRVLTRLKNKLDEIKGEYDVIIIDCPPNFNLITQNAIVASDFYIVPAKADYLSTLGINTLIRHVEELKRKFNQYSRQSNDPDTSTISPHMLGVIFTMVSYRNQQPISAQSDYINQIKRDRHCFTNFLRESKTIFAHAPESGIPVVLQRKNEQQELICKEVNGMVNEIFMLSNLS
nr:AAA family ATPase [Virgibacillus senegalensis]